MKEINNMLNEVFGVKPKTSKKQEIINTQTSVKDIIPQEITPERQFPDINTITNVQTMLWGLGQPAPMQNVKAPTQKATDKGTAPTLSNTEGWGKV